MSPPPSPWPLVGLLYLCGLLAAMQLGKLSALAPLIVDALGLRLTTMAWAISLIELGGACFGVVAGRLAYRLGLRRSLRGGVALLALAGLGSAGVGGATGLLLWRLVEAAGYLGITVTAPVLIAHHALRSGARAQALSMTLWSTFVPLGLAVGAFGSAAAAPVLGWRGAIVAGAGLAVMLGLALWRAPLPAGAERVDVGAAAGATGKPAFNPPNGMAGARDAPSSQAAAGLTPAIWCLTLGFGAFAVFEVGMLGLLPTLLVQEAGLSAAAAGTWAALAAASAVAGSALSAWLIRHGSDLRWPLMLSLLLPPLLLFGVFMPTPPVLQAVALAVLLNLLGGVFASLAFTLLPQLARSPGQMVRANGLLAQCGALGSLLGPPLMAACVQASGWPAAAALGLLVSLLAMPLAWHAAAAAQD